MKLIQVPTHGVRVFLAHIVSKVTESVDPDRTDRTPKTFYGVQFLSDNTTMQGLLPEQLQPPKAEQITVEFTTSDQVGALLGNHHRMTGVVQDATVIFNFFCKMNEIFKFVRFCRQVFSNSQALRNEGIILVQAGYR